MALYQRRWKFPLHGKRPRRVWKLCQQFFDWDEPSDEPSREWSSFQSISWWGMGMNWFDNLQVTKKGAEPLMGLLVKPLNYISHYRAFLKVEDTFPVFTRRQWFKIVQQTMLTWLICTMHICRSKSLANLLKSQMFSLPKGPEWWK